MKWIIALFLLIPLTLLSQDSFETKIDSISNLEEAQSFINSNKKGKVYIFNREKHKTRLAQDLFKLSAGGKKVIKSDFKTTYYKVIDKNRILHHRVHYISFDSSSMPLEDIEKLRNTIIAKYNNGYEFKTLAKYYSMDEVNAKKGGDSGWVLEGEMPAKLEQAIKSHNIDDIFKVDLPEENAYYVVLKSFEAKPIEEITVLKYTEAKR